MWAAEAWVRTVFFWIEIKVLFNHISLLILWIPSVCFIRSPLSPRITFQTPSLATHNFISQFIHIPITDHHWHFLKHLLCCNFMFLDDSYNSKKIIWCQVCSGHFLYINPFDLHKKYYYYLHFTNKKTKAQKVMELKILMLYNTNLKGT